MPALREIIADFIVRFDPQRTLQRGNQQIDRAAGNLRRLDPLAGRLTAGLGRMVAAIGGVVAISRLMSFTANTIRIGDELNTLSQRLGMSTQDLQAWQHAATMSDVNAGELMQGFIGLSRALGQMAEGGGGEVERIFRDLGVDARGQGGQLRSLGELLPDIADAFQQMTNPTERSTVALRLFGRSGMAMIPLLMRGREGIEAYRAELEALGGGASDEFVRAAAATDDELNRMRLSWLSLRSAIAVRVLPTITAIIQWLTRASVVIGKVTQSSHVLKSALIVLGVIAAGVAIATIGTWGPVAGVIMAAVVAVAALDSVMVGLEGGKSVVRSLVDSMGELVGWAEAGKDVFSALAWVIEQISHAITGLQAGLSAVSGFYGGRGRFGAMGEEAGRRGAASRRGLGEGAGRFWGSMPLVGSWLERRMAPGQIEGRQAAYQKQFGDTPAGNPALWRPLSETPSGRRRAAHEQAQAASWAQWTATPAGNPALWQPTATARPAQAVTQNVQAPSRVDLVINAATDAIETGRIAARTVREELEAHARRLQAALLPGSATPEAD